MLPVSTPLVEKGEYVHEIKWDGYRVLAYLSGDGVLLESRNGKSLNQRFPQVAAALDGKGLTAVFDGEVVAVDSAGRIDFSLLRQGGGPRQLLYIVFDLLYLDGENLCPRPWFERRGRLEQVLPSSELVVLSPLLPGDLSSSLAWAREKQLEGVISKERSSPYLPGERSLWWRKHKLISTLDCVVLGVKLRGNKVRSLAVGAYLPGGNLVYLGNVGSGLTERELDFLQEAAPLLVQEQGTAQNLPADEGPWLWFKPQLVVEVEYLELTRGLRLRHPVFVRFRFDKEPEECELEGGQKWLPNR